MTDFARTLRLPPPSAARSKPGRLRPSKPAPPTWSSERRLRLLWLRHEEPRVLLMGSHRPVFDREVRNTREIASIPCHENALVFECYRRNTKVHTSNVQLQAV